MSSQSNTFFALEFHKNMHVLGAQSKNWMFIYDVYFKDVSELKCMDLSSISRIATIPLDSNNYVSDIQKIDSSVVPNILDNDSGNCVVSFNSQKNTFFSTNTTWTETIKRKSSLKESLLYIEVIFLSHISLNDLKLRIYEIYLDFIPSSQYQVEWIYTHLLHSYREHLNTWEVFSSSKERKKEFLQLFHQKILPVLEKNNFTRVSNTSTRCIKDFKNGLSVVISFEHISFWSGSYSFSIAYFEELIGTYLDDNYLALVSPNFPYSSNLAISSYNKEVLNFDIDYFLRILQLYILPFIHKNSCHKEIFDTILNTQKISDYREEIEIQKTMKPAYFFEIPKNRENDIMQLLKNNITTMG